MNSLDCSTKKWFEMNLYFRKATVLLGQKEIEFTRYCQTNKQICNDDNTKNVPTGLCLDHKTQKILMKKITALQMYIFHMTIISHVTAIFGFQNEAIIFPMPKTVSMFSSSK